MGKILRVDLTSSSIKVEETDKEIAKKYIGGKGYATYLLYQYLKEYEKKGISPKDINPLGAEN
ncbi:MAG: aldehyde ferredoxin oxidoreductase, partial [Candidatus Hydrothermarchaeota archaeon]